MAALMQFAHCVYHLAKTIGGRNHVVVSDRVKIVLFFAAKEIERDVHADGKAAIFRLFNEMNETGIGGLGGANESKLFLATTICNDCKSGCARISAAERENR